MERKLIGGAQECLLKQCIRCKKCKGKETVKEKKRQEIYVEKGMTDRQRIVLAGEGDQSVSYYSVQGE